MNRSILVAALILGLQALPLAAEPRMQPAEAVAPAEGLYRADVRDARTGLGWTLYFDRGSEAAARAHVDYVSRVLQEDLRVYGHPPGAAGFHAVAFLHDPAAIRALRDRGVTAWQVDTDGQGAPTGAGRTTLDVVLAHEQVHALQQALYAAAVRDVPLWYVEGQAEWIGMHVADRMAPGSPSVQAHRQGLRAEYEAARGHIDLPAFARGAPTEAALKRQMSEAQWAHFQATGEIPAVPMRFTEDELVHSEHPGAHYHAAADVFDHVFRRAGLERMQAWFRAVEAEPGDLSSERIAVLALETTGVDIAPMLARR